MSGRCLILMGVIWFVVIRVFKKDYATGIALCVGLLVSLPDYLRVSFGSLPELTIHRLLLVTMLMFWWFKRKTFQFQSPVPLKMLFLLLAASQFLSLLFSINIKGSIKSYFVFILEIFTYFVVITTSLQDRKSINKTIYGIALGLAAVALIAGYERRSDINLSEKWVYGYDLGLEDVMSSYPHRIVLGYAMAMAVPIILAVREREPRKWPRLILFGLMGLAAAGCYFANSRGPWFGLMAGTMPLVLLGSRETKKIFVYMVLMGIVVVMLRPGVQQSLLERYYATFDKDTLKGQSYEYRWILWHVAASEISKSPERLLFGYGGLSTEQMDLSRYFEKEAGGNTYLTGFTSWDNQLACDLIELGFCGFLLEMVLFATALYKLIAIYRRSAPADRNFVLAFFSASAIYVYALSNVYIFSPQLKCLFWALVACGLRFGELVQAERLAAPVAQPAQGGRLSPAGASAQAGPIRSGAQ